MAMLADPRRRQKLSFDPRNTTWSNDESKFGHKLMEKMGWSKGKGLGANEDGHTQHISVSVKHDNRGVGCSKSHTDDWIAHQDDFNALLANLGQDHKSSEGNDGDGTSQVSSLEQKSRTSKGRLHYQKFTRGKDLSSRSEMDLDCVFGKRKSQSGTNTPQTQSEPSSDSEDKSNAFNTVTSTDSVQDYFKKKMAEKMNKLNSNVDSDSRLDNSEIGMNSLDDVKNDDTEVSDSNYSEIKTKSKKKSRKRKHDSEESKKFNEESVVLDDKSDRKENVEELIPKKKKSKKKKRNDCENGSCNNETENEINLQNLCNKNAEEETVSRKKSKKKKNRKICEVDEMEEKDSGDNTKMEMDLKGKVVESIEKSKEYDGEDKPKKKKKSKKRKRETNDLADVKPKKRVTFSIGGEDENVEEHMEVESEKDDFVKPLKNENPVSEPVEQFPSGGGNTPAEDKNEICENRHVAENDKSGFVKKGSYSMKVNKNTGFIQMGTYSRENRHSRNSGVSALPEVRRNGEAFRGANMKHLKGYVGLPINTYDVKKKLYNIQKKAVV